MPPASRPARRKSSRVGVQPARKPRRAPEKQLFLTIGHSNRTIAQFLQLLQAHGVSLLVDVRTIPRSRHNPQFNADSLPGSLKSAGIRYVHVPGLGGLRHASRNSLNTGWHNTSFRGFADYMQTPDFGRALRQLQLLGAKERVAVMCAEAVPWRCHRWLISDALKVRGFQVEHILSPTRREPHSLTSFAKADGLKIVYPPADDGSPLVAPI